MKTKYIYLFSPFQQVVYMARNPKDVVTSFYHHSRIFKNHDFDGTFEEFVQYFLDDDCT